MYLVGAIIIGMFKGLIKGRLGVRMPDQDTICIDDNGPVVLAYNKR